MEESPGLTGRPSSHLESAVLGLGLSCWGGHFKTGFFFNSEVALIKTSAKCTYLLSKRTKAKQRKHFYSISLSFKTTLPFFQR